MVYFTVSYNLFYIFAFLCFVLSDTTETSEQRLCILLVTLLPGPISSRCYTSLHSALPPPWRDGGRAGCGRSAGGLPGSPPMARGGTDRDGLAAGGAARARQGALRHRRPPLVLPVFAGGPGRPRGVGAGRAGGCAESPSPSGPATDTQMLLAGKGLQLQLGRESLEKSSGWSIGKGHSCSGCRQRLHCFAVKWINCVHTVWYCCTHKLFLLRHF